MFDSLINLFCIFILFGFSKNIYFKLCHCCDKCAKKCYIQTIMKQHKNDGFEVQEIQLAQLVVSSY